MASLLSSLEVLFVPDVDQILIKEGLQKVSETLSRLNRKPTLSHVMNPISDVRDCFVSNKGRFFRQSILVSEFFSSDHFALIGDHCLNPNGLLKSRPFYPSFFENGEFSERLRKVDVHVKNLEMSSDSSLKRGAEQTATFGRSFAKINVFVNDIWTKMRATGDWDQSVVVVGSFLEFKKLKELFKEKGSPVGFVSEHSTKQKVQSVIAKFNSGAKKHILITERAMYFDVLKPKRFRHLVFFSVPKFSFIFEDLTETLLDYFEYKKGVIRPEEQEAEAGEKESKQRLLICFGKREFYELERIVGTVKALEFMKSNDMFKQLSVWS